MALEYKILGQDLISAYTSQTEVNNPGGYYTVLQESTKPFFFIGGTYNTGATSEDGITWEQSAPTGNSTSNAKLVYGNGITVMFSASSLPNPELRYSKDGGRSWLAANYIMPTPYEPGAEVHIVAIDYDEKIGFFGVARENFNISNVHIILSKDGINWSKIQGGENLASPASHGMAYLSPNGIYALPNGDLAVSFYGYINNGPTYTYYTKLMYTYGGNFQYWMVAQLNGSNLISDSSPQNATSKLVYSDNIPGQVMFFTGYDTPKVFVGPINSLTQYSVSPYLVRASSIIKGKDNALYGYWHNQQSPNYLAIVKSNDGGLYWTQQSINPSARAGQMIYANDKYYIISEFLGEASTICESSDAITWTIRSIGVPGSYGAIVYGSTTDLVEVQNFIGGQGTSLETVEQFLPVTVYTVPQGKSTIITSIFVTNHDSSESTYDLAVVPAGEELSLKHHLRWDYAIAGNDFDNITTKITMSSGDSLVVFPSTVDTLSITAFGVEQ